MTVNGTAVYDEFARHSHVPRLVLDAVALAERLDRDELPNAHLVMLPGADELWFVGDTAALAEQIDRWLADLRPTPDRPAGPRT